MEIAGLADTTLVVVVPESGDEIQTLKSGIMEIADIFVVNKSDREGADVLANTLQKMLHDFRNTAWTIPVINVSATMKEGISELIEAIDSHTHSTHQTEKKNYLLCEKAYRLIQQSKMKDIHKQELLKDLKQATTSPDFNLYLFANQYLNRKIGDS